MTTARQIITNAFRKINIVAMSQAPSPEDADHGLTTLNTMLSGWKAEGVDLEQATLDLSGSLTTDAKYDDAITLLLGMRLASDYQRPALFAADAADAWQTLTAGHLTIASVTMPSALLKTPSQRSQNA